MKNLKGVATVELTNVNSGKKRKIVSENIVTNAIADIYGKAPFGQVLPGTTPRDLMSGLMLFEEEIPENPNNYKINYIPKAWASDDVSPTGGIGRGSANLNETILLENGYQFVWDFSTSQGNGTYKTICLGNPIPLRSDSALMGTGLPPRRGLYSGIPWERFRDGDHVYAITRPDTESFGVQKIYRPTLAFGLCRRLVANAYAEFNNSPNLEIKSFPSHTIPLTTSLPLTSTYISSAYFTDTDLFLITVQNNSKNVRVVKINKASLETETPIYTENLVTFSGLPVNLTGGDTTQPEFVFSNRFPFHYPYMILGSSARVFKVNLEDASDITELAVTDAFSNIRSSLCVTPFEFYIIPSRSGLGTVTYLRSWTVSTGQTQIGNAGMISYFVGASDTFPYIMVEDTGGQNYMYLNTYYLATINQVQPFQKTASDTMKITYTITQTI